MLSLYELYKPLEVLAIMLAPVACKTAGFACLYFGAVNVVYILIPKSQEKFLDYILPPLFFAAGYVLIANGISLSLSKN